MRRSLIAAATLAAVLLAGAPTADARCAQMPTGPQVVTPAGAVAGGGGVLVETEALLSEAAIRALGPGAITLEVNGKRTTVTAEALAPGLVVYRLPARARSARLLVGKKLLRAVRAGKAVAALAAPTVTGTSTFHRMSTDPRGVGQRMRTTVTLGAAPPAGARALIVYDQSGTARTFARVDARSTAVVVYEHERCRQFPAGMSGLGAGETGTVAFVDASGIVGARSAPFTVAAEPDSAPE